MVALSSTATAFNIVLIPVTGVTVTITYDDNGTEDTRYKLTNRKIRTYKYGYNKFVETQNRIMAVQRILIKPMNTWTE